MKSLPKCKVATLDAIFKPSLKEFLKVYPNAKSDVDRTISSIEKAPLSGDAIIGLYNKVFKTRGNIKTYNIGKSKGIRLIYYFNGSELYLLFIYGKTYRGNHPLQLLKDALNGLEEALGIQSGDH